ncbi:MAG TPA: tetratricopeptide repeat protein [Anaerolineaceae bacterium]|nr:tetratricopeptide repeat protein [Anaerolineaceae bacterium]
MAKISLRQYHHDIEKLIEQGKTQEAVTHLKHILQRYPKNLDSYRLLGKAYLESEHYVEASDIFQRVLACTPDDFVAQIGMSIITEAEENLDAAIWHMERAFDIQPSNPAVHDELSRLYGIRDGASPEKIRLSRGALIRMYTRGNLYQQAISEVRAALLEEPERYDLRVQLARLYWLSGNQVQAAESCTELLKEYPYCLEANRTLASILPTTARSEESHVFEERVVALDPYTQFISPSAPEVSRVPDQSVMLERLEWQGDDLEELETQPPNQTVEALPEAQPAYETPAWLLPEIEKLDSAGANDLSPISSEGDSNSELSGFSGNSLDPFSIEASSTEESGASMIPDWMKGAGWSLGNGDVDEQTDVYANEEPLDTADNGGEIVQAEIPSWIQSLAPKSFENLEPTSDTRKNSHSAEPEAAQEGELFEADIPAWVQSLAPIEPAEPEDDAQDLQAILNTIAKPDPEPQVIPSDQLFDQVPEWLNPMLAADEPEPAQDSVIDQPPAVRRMDASEWTLETPPAAEAPTIEPQTASVEPETQGFAEPSASQGPSVQATPVTDPVETIPTLPEDATIAIQNETNAWLESLAAIYGSEKETVFAHPEDRVKTPPTWILDESHLPKAETGSPEPAKVDPTPTPTQLPADQDFPAWESGPVDDMAGSKDSNGFYPKTEGWQLEFNGQRPNLTAPLSEPEEPQPERSSGPGTSLLPEIDMEKLVSDAMPAWDEPKANIPSQPVEPPTPQFTAPLSMDDQPQMTAPLHMDEGPLTTAPLHLEGNPLVPPRQKDAGQQFTASLQFDENPMFTAPLHLEEDTPHLEPEMDVPTPVGDDKGVAAALERARSHLMDGEIFPAIDDYNHVIESGEDLDEMISDLQQALYRYPVEPALWETLGNAYARIDKIQDALDAYTKAEELVH